MGKCCSCFTFLSEQKREVSINLTDLEKPNFNHSALDLNKHQRNHLQIFLRNVGKLSRLDKYRLSQINHRQRQPKKQTLSASPTASFTSISCPQNDANFNIINNPLACGSNCEETDCNDYENFEFDQFSSPELQLIGTNSFLGDEAGCFNGNDYQNIISHYDNKNISKTKRQFFLNQINQVNVDGFEWDLI